MEKTVKIISVLLAAVLLVSAVPFAVTAANNTSQAVGDYQREWTLESGTLTIYGNAYMHDYGVNDDDRPWNTSDVKKIVIENGVEYIGESVFRKCEKLKEVVIAATVTEIGDFAFLRCPALTKINLPDSITRIGYGCFRYCGSLKNITLPSNLTEVEGCTFEECSLESIVIPDTVEFIGDWAFSDNQNLTSVTLGKSIRKIDNNAFSRTGLTEITIPASVTEIGERAFGYEYKGGGYRLVDGYIIYGRSGSAAEAYANENGITFISQDPLIGDANLDGVVDVRDVTVIQRHIAEYELLTGEKLECADVDGDGEVTVADATLLQMYLAEFDVQIV